MPVNRKAGIPDGYTDKLPLFKGLSLDIPSGFEVWKTPAARNQEMQTPKPIRPTPRAPKREILNPNPKALSSQPQTPKGLGFRV